MLCERCKKEEASIHLTEIIKDVKSEVHLCETCAREIGLNSKLSNFSLSVPEMLSFLEVNEVSGNEQEDTACRMCGTTFMQYSRQGKLGCADCYTQLESSLAAVIRSYHGDRKHVGKMPVNYSSDEIENVVEKIDEEGLSIRELQERLQNAVMDERFEDAAVLRDRINRAMNS